MTHRDTRRRRIDDARLRALVELAASSIPSLQIKTIERQPSPYQSSFPLEDVTVTSLTGAQWHFLLKMISPDALPGDADHAKPGFVHDERREIEVYRSALSGHELGTPAVFAVWEEGDAGLFALLLERVDGTRLDHCGDFDLWRAVAAWLARFHTECRPLADDSQSAVAECALQYDEVMCRIWRDRARVFVDDRLLETSLRLRWRRLLACYDNVIDRFVRLPMTLLHGDFFAANVLVTSAQPPRVAVVDWEMATIGPPWFDLACLIAGKWDEDEKRLLTATYLGASGLHEITAARDVEWQGDLAVCRLQLAVQMLGWAKDWKAPLEQRNDWLEEALLQAEVLGL